MKSEYDYYLIGCRSQGVAPLTLWRFRLLYEAYQRRQTQALPERDPQRAPLPSPAVERLAALVRLGQEISASVRAEGEEPGAAGCGVREPRVPLEPVLCGGDARPLPTLDAPDQSFWRV